LEGRIRDAKWLAFYYATDHTLGAVAALRALKERYRRDVFKKADVPVSPADYQLELGWVFVAPAHRGNRIAESLCRRLLARAPEAGVFVTTRTNNIPMIKILLALDFVRAGTPYPRRNEELLLFSRAGPTFGRHAAAGGQDALRRLVPPDARGYTEV
jgi:GNAT superfamily N-acetyltransferase